MPEQHDARLHPSTIETLRWLTDPARGDTKVDIASVTFRERHEGEPYLELTRPGKARGVSGTLGYISPGVLKVFTSNWPGLSEQGRYDIHDLHTVEGRAHAGDVGGDQTTDEEPHQELAEGSLRSVPLGRRMASEVLVGKWLHVTNLGWHHWDGTRWKASTEDQVVIVAANWAENFIIGLVKDGAPSDTIKTALKYRDVGNVKNLVAGARTHHGVLVQASKLDAHPGLLNCANGVLDLRTGNLQPHDPALLLTKTTGVDYVAGATHRDWTKPSPPCPTRTPPVGCRCMWVRLQPGRRTGPGLSASTVAMVRTARPQ